jgi:hypothetical protein
VGSIRSGPDAVVSTSEPRYTPCPDTAVSVLAPYPPERSAMPQHWDLRPAVRCISAADACRRATRRVQVTEHSSPRPAIVEVTTVSTRARVRDATALLAQGLQDPVDKQSILESLTSSAAVSIPGFEGASVSVRTGDDVIQTLTASTELAIEIDQLQYELREGPCYDVISGTHSTVVTFMDDDGRWPRFAPRAAELGVGSMMSFELTERPGLRSALNLYSRQGGGIEADAVNIAELFAAHAATTLELVDRIEQLESGLRTRTVIGEAVGITMERYDITHDRAFQFLVRLSQNTNIKLRDIAGDMVDEHDERVTNGGTTPEPAEMRLPE